MLLRMRFIQQMNWTHHAQSIIMVRVGDLLIYIWAKTVELVLPQITTS